MLVSASISWTGTSQAKATGNWTLKRSVQSTPLSALSGIVLNLNNSPIHDTDFIGIGGDWYFQEFYLPDNYVRGEGSEARVPDLTGFQVCVGVAEGSETAASLSWQIETYEIGVGWLNLGRGTAIGAQASGDMLWFDVYCDQPIDVSAYFTQLFRFGIQGRSATGVIEQAVPYDPLTQIATVNGQAYRVNLINDIPYNFQTNDGVPGILLFDTATQQVLYSVQQGIDKVWFTTPNPHSKFALLYGADGHPIENDGVNATLLYRVLAATADSGIDFLGNPYRRVVTKQDAGKVASDADVNSYWLSKPNPSAQAVESLYFDLSLPENGTQVVDAIYIDPLTPNVLCNVYYSTDGQPGSNQAEWDQRIWHLAFTFYLRSKDTYTLPNPIATNYIKLEFTHLQAKPYDPFNQYKPISYHKFPHWVKANHELVKPPLPQQQTASHDPFITNTKTIQLNLLNFLFHIDLDKEGKQHKPKHPTLSKHEQDEFASQVDFRINHSTLAKIDLDLHKWAQNPSGRTHLDEIIRFIDDNTGQTDGNRGGYPIESLPRRAKAKTTLVSSVQKDKALAEQNPPQLAFTVPCQHIYKQVKAKLPTKKAYFVGINEVAFVRSQYTVAYDSDMYIEIAGDETNLAKNDFFSVNQTWQCYNQEQ